MELTMTRCERPSNDPRRGLDEHGHEIEESDRGLVYDLQTLVDRRKVLGLFGGLSAAALLAACGGSVTNGSAPTAEGVPLEIRLTVRDAATGDAAKGAGVYLWQCDRDGNYSLYSQAAANENYLRGAQEADANGAVTFQSIFPACYSGRWPHIHFEVHETLSDATSSGPIVKTSQIALPKEP